MKIKYHRKRFKPLKDVEVGSIVADSRLSKLYLVTDCRDDTKIELVDVSEGKVLWTSVDVDVYVCQKWNVLFGNSEGTFIKTVSKEDIDKYCGCVLVSYAFTRSAYIRAKDGKFFDLWSGKQVTENEVTNDRNEISIYTEGQLEVIL